MSFLRYVTNYKYFQAEHFNPEGIRSALQDAPNERPSVYRIVSPEFADRLCVLHGMSFKARPATLDYVLLPAALLLAHDLTPERTPGDIEHPLLVEAHHEIVGLTPAKLEDLCSSIETAAVAGKRLRKSDVRSIAKKEASDRTYGAAARALVSSQLEGWAFLFEDAEK
jgi:hypothetical protein